VNVPVVVTRPILLAPLSVNQRAPSGPGVMEKPAAVAVGIANSVKTPAVRSRRRSKWRAASVHSARMGSRCDLPDGCTPVAQAATERSAFGPQTVGHRGGASAWLRVSVPHGAGLAARSARPRGRRQFFSRRAAPRRGRAPASWGIIMATPVASQPPKGAAGAAVAPARSRRSKIVRTAKQLHRSPVSKRALVISGRLRCERRIDKIHQSCVPLRAKAFRFRSPQSQPCWSRAVSDVQSVPRKRPLAARAARQQRAAPLARRVAPPRVARSTEQ
jgi:hypothetical protein